MNHHRCSRCKEESYPRHKYHGGVFCDGCIKMVKGHRDGGGFFFRVRSLWHRIADWFSDFFIPEGKRPDVEVIERKRHHELKMLEAKMRRLPTARQYHM